MVPNVSFSCVTFKLLYKTLKEWENLFLQSRFASFFGTLWKVEDLTVIEKISGTRQGITYIVLRRLRMRILVIKKEKKNIEKISVGSVHRILESFSTRFRINSWFFTRGC
jgi:biotin-(acetyl-CoA carboxylase) ligase